MYMWSLNVFWKYVEYCLVCGCDICNEFINVMRGEVCVCVGLGVIVFVVMGEKIIL